jgi:CheY-like chemotaxis protein
VSAGSSGKRDLIIVADDDADILDLVCVLLEEAGYEVAPAVNGAEALRLARERPPALFVFDVQMPEMTGYEALERLRADGLLQEVPVILLTASVQEREIARGFELGATALLRKPFSPRELQSEVDALLKRP